MILADTNIFIRVAVNQDPLHDAAMRGLKWVLSGSDELAVAPQVLYEFWVVATRPLANNGLGWQPNRAAVWLARIQRLCQFISDDVRVYQEWARLVTTHGHLENPPTMPDLLHG